MSEEDTSSRAMFTSAQKRSEKNYILRRIKHSESGSNVARMLRIGVKTGVLSRALER